MTTKERKIKSEGFSWLAPSPCKCLLERILVRPDSPRSRLIWTFFYICERFCLQGPGNELFSREHVIQNRESTSRVSAVSAVFIPPHLHLQHMRMAAHLPALEFFIACQ